MKTSLVSWALDDLPEYQAIRQNFFLMGTKSIGRVVSARSVVDGVELPVMLKRDDVLLSDVVYVTNYMPGNGNLRHSLRPAD